MDLQLFAVIIIAILVAIVLIRGVYRFFFVKRESGGCLGCKGCELHPRLP
jgi:hypothetical protein